MKFLFSTFCIIFIAMLPFECGAQDLKGPKIFGLQLGMPVEQAKDIVNNICKNMNKELSETDSTALSLGIGADFYGCFGTASIHFERNYIYRYNIGASVFNYTPAGGSSYFGENFLKEFISKYNIPELDPIQENYGIYSIKWQYTDDNEGWRIILTDSVTVNEIKKVKFE